MGFTQKASLTRHLTQGSCTGRFGKAKIGGGGSGSMLVVNKGVEREIAELMEYSRSRNEKGNGAGFRELYVDDDKILYEKRTQEEKQVGILDVGMVEFAAQILGCQGSQREVVERGESCHEADGFGSGDSESEEGDGDDQERDEETISADRQSLDDVNRMDLDSLEVEGEEMSPAEQGSNAPASNNSEKDNKALSGIPLDNTPVESRRVDSVLSPQDSPDSQKRVTELVHRENAVVDPCSGRMRKQVRFADVEEVYPIN